MSFRVFVGVQVLRVFYPKAYALIDHNNDLLTGSIGGAYEKDFETKLQKSFYSQLHEQVSENTLEYFKALMGRLFPKYAQIVENGMGYGCDWEAKWKQHRKVCSEQCFDFYFTLSIPDDSFTFEEMQAIISLVDNQNEFKEKLLVIIDKDKSKGKYLYKSFLRELEEFTEKVISKNQIKSILQSIYDVSDKVDPDDNNNRGFMDVDG